MVCSSLSQLSGCCCCCFCDPCQGNGHRMTGQDRMTRTSFASFENTDRHASEKGQGFCRTQQQWQQHNNASVAIAGLLEHHSMADIGEQLAVMAGIPVTELAASWTWSATLSGLSELKASLPPALQKVTCFVSMGKLGWIAFGLISSSIRPQNGVFSCSIFIFQCQVSWPSAADHYMHANPTLYHLVCLQPASTE